MTRVKLFKDVRIGKRFSFRFGIRGERGPYVRVTSRSYECPKTGQRWSVGTTQIEVR